MPTDSASTPPLTVGSAATLSCVWEATAAKPGNVYRGADFDDMTYVDFLTSATVIGPAFDRCGDLGLGGTVLEAVKATQNAVGVNTNLGTILLLAPLALAEGDVTRADAVVRSATSDDTTRIYEAIRLALPGGLGEVDQGDVSAPPEHSLFEAMRLAADRDLVARQLTSGFSELVEAAESIAQHLSLGVSLHDAVVMSHVALIAEYGDSLIGRKLGREMMCELATRAGNVLLLTPGTPEFVTALADLDFWLRADGNRRNPGTTADLIAAALFLLLLNDRIEWPVRFYT